MSQTPLFNNQLALVVDDELVARTVAKRTLVQLGFDVTEADDGVGALEQLQNQTPDIILLDVEMETINGIETCRRARSISRFANTPIIMMTAHEDAESIDQAFNAGATDFITKPVNWTLLKHKITYVMRNQEVLLELSNAERIAGIGSWRQLCNSTHASLSTGLKQLLGVADDELINIMDFVHSADRDHFQDSLFELRNNKTMSLKHRMIDKHNNTLIVEHRAQALSCYNGESKGVLATVRDITEKEKANARVHHLAYHDALTTLFNRTATMERLEYLCNSADNKHASFALLHVDIDNFKRINDSLGPAVGDLLLNATAQKITTTLNKLGYPQPTSYETPENLTETSNLNMVARLGADAFAVLLVDDWSRKKILDIGNSLVAELGCQYSIDVRQLTISTSIGVAVYPDHGNTAAEINQSADTALHSVKLLSKNDIKLYDVKLSDVVQRKMQLEEHLRLALKNNEFTLNYQPQIDIADLQVVGAEALLRWTSAELGSVSPIDFIPLAEEIGLIVPIGNWVLKTACEQLAQWNDAGINLPRLAVNISVRQFNQDDFVSVVSQTLEDSGVDPTQLELEITESLLAVNVASAIEKLESLKQLGVEISVDDFGTGYSSLSYLKKFPIDRLKIDKSFVRDLDHDNADLAITESIIGLARGLSLSVIAEGVETNEHLAKLTELGCDEAQGYLIGKPIPHNEFVEWLQNYKKLLKTNGLTKVA